MTAVCHHYYYYYDDDDDDDGDNDDEETKATATFERPKMCISLVFPSIYVGVLNFIFVRNTFDGMPKA